MSTEWRNVIDRYSVSNTGRVMNNLTGRELRLKLNQKGYLRVTIYVNQQQKTLAVHRLVALAFIPNDINLPIVNHKDGNKKNNNVENLEWCTEGENQKHAYDNGLRVQYKGSKHGRSKLTDGEVLEIRKLRSDGFTTTEISQMFGISASMVSCIALNKNWKHI